MSSPMVSRWPVVIAVKVAPEDAGPDGRLTEDAALRLFAVARDAYLDLCTTVDRSALEVRSTSVRMGPAEVTDTVSVSAGVTEVYTDSFTMTSRIRPTETDEVAADVICTFSPGSTVPRDMRDEFIALAHSASHFH